MTDDLLVVALEAKIDALHDEIRQLLSAETIAEDVGYELYRLSGELDAVRLQLALGLAAARPDGGRTRQQPASPPPRRTAATTWRRR